MLKTDVTSTLLGAVLGTSTVTSLAESAAGISMGARTGLASLVTGSLFLVALFFSPIVAIVPGYATAPALLMVGVYMFKNIAEIDFKNFKTLVISFITIIIMPLTYSIAIGLSFGFITYILVHLITKEYHKLNPTLIVIGILSLINLVV
jgi:AGZA family xanthine/uracil permease-like MFS transporter